jgi:hypothetical protein
MLSPNSEPSVLYLCSSLPSGYRQELEEIFFFNPKQKLVAEKVKHHIRAYGAPSIRSVGGRISLQLSKVQYAQTLFLMMPGKRSKLIGMLLYVREGKQLIVLYLVLNPENTVYWHASCSIISHVIGLLKNVARSIKGVEQIQISITEKSIVFNA